MALLGATAAIRFLRMVPAIASMASADTLNQLYSNVCRCISLPVAAAAAYAGAGTHAIASCALGAEVLAAIYSTIRLNHRQKLRLRDSAPAAAFVVVFIVAALAF